MYYVTVLAFHNVLPLLCVVCVLTLTRKLLYLLIHTTMANSRDFELAQTPKPCELCEAGTNIKFKCTDCSKFICERCRKIHSNVPTLAHHQIVEIKSTTDLHLIKSKVHLESIPCEIHRKFHCLFCKTCSKLVCPDCITNSHTKHDFVPIDKACEEKRSQLEELDTKFENEIEDLRQYTQKLQMAKYKWECMVSETEKLINENELEIQELVAKHAEKLRDDIAKKSKVQINCIDTMKTQIAEKQSNLITHRETIKSIIEGNEGIHIFKAALEIDNYSSKLGMPICSLPNVTVGILPPTISKETIGELFGSLSEIATPSVVNLELVKQFSSNISCVDKIAISSSGLSWISAFESGKDVSYLLKTKLYTPLNKAQKINVDVFDMAVFMDKDLLVSVHLTSEVKRISNNGKIEPFIDVSPLIARGIHVTNENEILLGVRDNGDPYLTTDNSCRKIIVFDSDGNEKQSYEFDRNNQRLFTIPRRITTNLHGDIVVSNSTAKAEGRVLAFGRRGDIKWEYKGGNVKLEVPFDPDDIVSTGLIVVTDERNHTLFILSPVGDLLTYKDLTVWQIYGPRSVAVDVDGQLWIGCAMHSRKNDDSKKKQKQYANMNCIKFIY